MNIKPSLEMDIVRALCTMPLQDLQALITLNEQQAARTQRNLDKLRGELHRRQLAKAQPAQKALPLN